MALRVTPKRLFVTTILDVGQTPGTRRWCWCVFGGAYAVGAKSGPSAPERFARLSTEGSVSKSLRCWVTQGKHAIRPAGLAISRKLDEPLPERAMNSKRKVASFTMANEPVALP
jgi:hypothetical protein